MQARAVVGTRSPVHGLARRSLPFTDVLAQPLAAVAPSAAATTLPLLIATVAGRGSVLLGLVLASLLAASVAGCVNQFTRRVAATGSLYTFVVRGLGPHAGVVTGVAMVLGYGAITVFALAGGGRHAQSLLARAWPALAPDGPAGDLPALAAIVALGAGVWWVLRRGIRRSARVTLVVEVVSVALIVALVLAVIFSVGPGTVAGAVVPVPGTGVGDVAVATVVALTAFVGFESAAALGAEARRPFRTVPRAMTWTAVGAGLLYLLAGTAQLLGYASAGLDLAGARSPADELTGAYGLAWAGAVLDGAIVASFAACAMASSTALARVLFTMGREGLAPCALGRTHPVHGTPSTAFAGALPVLVGIPTVAASVTGVDLWSVMQVVLLVSAGGYLTAYVLVCAAVPPFLFRIGESSQRIAVLAVGTALVLTGALVTTLVVQGDTPRQAGVWVFLALLAVGAGAGLLRVHRRPGLGSRLGVHDEPVVTDLLTASARPGVRPPGGTAAA